MSFGDILSRATARILAHASASGCVLRGEIVDPPRDIHIAHDVEVTGEFGQVVGTRSVATINDVDTPAKGDTLAAGGKDYVLDARLDDNGYSQRWMLREV